MDKGNDGGIEAGLRADKGMEEDGGMKGWKDGEMPVDRWMKERMEGYIVDGRTEKWWLDGGWMDEREGRMDGWMEE